MGEAPSKYTGFRGKSWENHNTLHFVTYVNDNNLTKNSL